MKTLRLQRTPQPKFCLSDPTAVPLLEGSVLAPVPCSPDNLGALPLSLASREAYSFTPLGDAVPVAAIWGCAGADPMRAQL